LNEKLYDNLEKSISKDRLEHYSTVFDTNDKKIVIQKYLLNIELSKALYFPLQKFETTLINNIHNILATQLKTDKWYETKDFLTVDSYKRIDDAKKNITKELTYGRVVSELNFGFCCALFSKSYDQKICNKKNTYG
jgi:hypothetical protein